MAALVVLVVFWKRDCMDIEKTELRLCLGSEGIKLS